VIGKILTEFKRGSVKENKQRSDVSLLSEDEKRNQEMSRRSEERPPRRSCFITFLNVFVSDWRRDPLSLCSLPAGDARRQGGPGGSASGRHHPGHQRRQHGAHDAHGGPEPDQDLHPAAGAPHRQVRGNRTAARPQTS